jgi:hypothetical protein
MVHIVTVHAQSRCPVKVGLGSILFLEAILGNFFSFVRKNYQEESKAIPSQGWELSLVRLVALFLNFIRRNSKEQLE